MSLHLHLPWTPQQKTTIPLIVTFVFIICIALVTRLWNLGSTPSGVTWDEAALGYVGKMVVTTGRDEHGRLLPRAFESFGDYKAPLAMYSTGISTTLFGLSPWAVRLPFALAGIASVLVMMRIGWLVFRDKWLAAATGFFLTVLPWHLHFSRIAFESGLTLFFLTLILWGYLELRKHADDHTKSPVWPWLLIVGGSVASLYVYHSAKLTVPLTLALLAWTERKSWMRWWKQSRTPLLASLVASVVLLLPFVQTLIAGTALQRATQTSLLATASSPAHLVGTVVRNFLEHLSLQFLIFGETATLRHGNGHSGVLLWTQLILLLMGIAIAFLPRKEQAWRSKLSQAPSLWLWLGLAIIGLLPAAIGFEVPHPNRALLAAIPFVVLITTTLSEVRKRWQEIPAAAFIGMSLLLMSLEFCVFWNELHTTYRMQSSYEWLDGSLTATRLAHQYASEGKTVFFSGAYGQPEIFYGFANNIPADQYRARNFPNITFGDEKTTDLTGFDVVFLINEETLLRHPDAAIFRADGNPAYRVYVQK